jgi:hypothetical protein
LEVLSVFTAGDIGIPAVICGFVALGKKNELLVQGARVARWPTFPLRGLSLDCSQSSSLFRKPLLFFRFCMPLSEATLADQGMMIALIVDY